MRPIRETTHVNVASPFAGRGFACLGLRIRRIRHDIRVLYIRVRNGRNVGATIQMYSHSQPGRASSGILMMELGMHLEGCWINLVSFKNIDER